MKNKLIIIFLLYSFFFNHSIAEQFRFETSEIELIDKGNLVYATNGKAISADEDIEIIAEKFEFLKIEDILKAFNGTAHFKSDGLKVKFDEIILDQKNLITNVNKNVEIIDLKNNLIIETDSITLNKKKNILESFTKTLLKDEKKNVITSSNLKYSLQDGILKLKNLNLKDFNNNEFLIDVAFIDTSTNRLIGKDISINLNKDGFNKENEPRIKGNSITYENDTAEIIKGVFTTCKKREDKCPPWELSAEKIQHDKKNKVINYKNTFLKIYDIPVMYFPKFFHPDPTVKRRSGFLIPTIKNSPNSNSFLSVPYFSVISQNKDITFTPRFYSNDKVLIQSEYRQENANSSHITDLSLLSEKNQDSKTHFFYEYEKLFDITYFEEGNLNLKIEKTSNDTYLRSNKLSSPIIKNYNTLENYFSLNLYSEDLSIKSNITIYENLDEENTHDKYEFILPKIDITKRLKNFTNLSGNFLFNSSNYIRNFQTNIFEKININDLVFNSNPKITNKGFYNNYDFIIKNVNSDTQNSSSYKNGENFYLSGIFQYNTTLPLIKEKNGYTNILKPKISLRISPNDTKNLSDTVSKRLDVNNIFNIDRLSSNNTIEGGLSLTYGNEFTIFDQKESIEIFSIKLANNLRLDENDDLPKNNQLNSKTSNFFGEILFKPNDLFSVGYNASTRNNLTDINYENFKAEISLNNFVTTFDYLNENNSLEKNTYLTNTTEYNFDDANSIRFSTRENKSSNLTEYYNLIYEYKNDCLAASIEYNKDYYDDRDIKPEESIFLKLTIIPFGETSSPNLNK